jgi:hypothetical protein
MRPALLITIDVASDNLWARREEITLDTLRQMSRLHLACACEQWG